MASWPAWWPDYRSVERVSAVEHGAGVRWRARVKAHLPYTLDFSFTVLVHEPPRLVRTRVEGFFTGEIEWRLEPAGSGTRMTLVEDTEIDGSLVDWNEKGSTVEYLGTEDVDGTAAHKLKVVRKNGDVSFVYLDPDHFLEIRIVTGRMRHGAYEEVETDLGDYEKVGGVFVPTSIEAGPKGAPDKQRTIIDKVEANVPVDDAIFHFPGQINIAQPQR